MYMGNLLTPLQPITYPLGAYVLIEVEIFIIHVVDDVRDLNLIQVTGVHGLVVKGITYRNGVV